METIKSMQERLKFYEEQLKKIQEDLLKDETFLDTPRYTNFMGIATNLINLINQLKSMIKSREEAEAMAQEQAE